MSEDLKHCPFCGGEAVPTRRNYSCAVVCKNCAACAFGDTETAAITAWNRRARPSPTGEKVEAVALPDERIIEIAVSHSNYRGGPQGVEVFTHQRIIAFARDIEARTIAALVAERDEARAELAGMKANWDANVYEMSERFRAVNIERMAKQVDQDAVIWRQEASARADAAESALATANARVERLEKALREIARQKRTDELDTEYDVEMASFEDGYDLCIDRARAALEPPHEAP